ncbi:hypothetical protein HIM_05924 [Hirsutella minnesotensis 3608]|uniref:Uncharacterized protein n=1 Tax=Hirsutella minnesotensis 3608 TaxID=1043627 RepID=A0A0F8A522_9HYPO|nr:hypothetical protein HIM_05924 [Hirsutella minnesotensis 3608]
MAPETRSRGAAPPSRVYHSSPSLQQAQFPSRRKKIRTYGRQTPARLRQQTLTQIDFVSSFEGQDEEDDVVVLTDSEEEGRDKENENPKRVPVKHKTENSGRKVLAEIAEPEVERADQNQMPESSNSRRRHVGGKSKRKSTVPPSPKASKGKRRRTLGDDADFDGGDDDKAARRRTMGDSPASSKFHTQTLTQFLGHRTLIADSDDDEPLTASSDHDEDNGFLDWLGDPGSPSIGRRKTADRPLLSPRIQGKPGKSAARHGSQTTMRSREESVIPQTPVKRDTTVRYAIPADTSAGLKAQIDRYGPPNVHFSPLKDRSSPAVVQPLSELTGTPRHLQATPTRRRTSPLKTLSARKKAASPKKTRGGREVIPDSDEDDGFDQESVQDDERCYAAGVETQFVMHALASTEEQGMKLPCSDLAQPSSTISPAPAALRASSAAAEAAASSTSSLSDPPSPKVSESPTLQSSRKTHTKPLRKPIHHNHSSQLYSQPLESQRVPIAVLQSLPPPGARSDIILPIDDASLDPLLSGHVLHISKPFKIPDQVVRFWLLGDAMLRYMVCVEPADDASTDTARWRYTSKQVYELNNPMLEEDMREEGWFDGPISKYAYLPPAVVGQLLWNLRHAVFGDGSQDSDEDVPEEAMLPPTGKPGRRGSEQQGYAGDETPSTAGMTVSQQVDAQIHSDIAQSTQLVPSTPNAKHGDRKHHVIVDTTPVKRHSVAAQKMPSSPSDAHDVVISSSPRLPLAPPRRPYSRPVPTPSQPLPRPSQATTVSQASTPEKPQSHRQPSPGRVQVCRPIQQESSGSLAFLDSANSYASVAVSSSPAPASQLLTKSQMLPETLLRDHSQPPAEIWDSDSDDAPL